MKLRWIAALIVALLELGVCAGIGVVAWGSLSAIDLKGARWVVFAADNVTATATEETQYPVTGPATVTLNKYSKAASGNVKVTVGKGSDIVIRATRTAWGQDLTAAQAELARIQVAIKQSGNDIDIQTTEPEQIVVVGRFRPSSVDLEIEVPLKTSTYLVTGTGNVDVVGTRGPVHVETDAGVVTGSDLGSGVIEAQTGFGDIQLTDIQAISVSATANSGSVSLKGSSVSAEVRLRTDFGNIELTDSSAGSLSGHTNSGRVEADKCTVAADASLSSDFGDIVVAVFSAKRTDLRSSSGTIRITSLKGDLTAHTDFGDVTANDPSQGSVDLSSNSGKIYFAGGLGPDPYKFGTDFGQIILTLPPSATASFDLKTDFGTIRSDLPVTLSGNGGVDHWTGRLGAGGSQLTADTKSGDISIIAASK